jgi:phytoene dehydrogenase-like protein
MLTDGTHGIPAGTLVVAPSIPYLEYAYDAAKYGGISAQPYLEITTSDKVVSVHVQYAAFALKDLNWNDQRPALERLVAEALAEHFPNLRASVRQVRSLTPPDLEATYGLTEGDLNHGQLMLDQFMFMRPIPGWSNHKTPIDNLFLGGSGVHGGGGVSGLGGRNAARAVLRS